MSAAALVGATLFWAGNYVIGEATVREVSPLSLVALRWLIAALPLLLIAQAVEKPDWRAALRAWPWILILSLTGLIGFNLFLYAALQHTTAVNAALVTAFNPALISLAAALLLRDRLGAVGAVGVAVAFAGVLLVLSGGDIAALFASGFGTGELLVMGAILAWTAYTILGRKAPRMPPITSTALQSVVGAVIASSAAFASGGITLPPPGAPSWALLYIALFPSVLSYLLWNGALRVIPPSRAGVFLNLITVFTVIIALFIGVPVSLAELLGGAVILCGIALTYVSPAKKSRLHDDVKL